MIEFTQRNPNFVNVVRDGIDIGHIQRTSNPNKPGEQMWSGIVDNRIIKADTLCLAKQKIHDFIDDHARIDITPAGLAALAAVNQHSPMRQAKLRAVTEHGKAQVGAVAARFCLAESLLNQNKPADAADVLAPILPAIEQMLRRLKFAGIECPVVAEIADQAAE